ncbi:MAG: hypothetical protein DMG05_25150 [Acidobacteria bacterium]|nr:MAG: hypothetical protein DMG05_25150 [Acidobacteriota bacterium]
MIRADCYSGQIKAAEIGRARLPPSLMGLTQARVRPLLTRGLTVSGLGLFGSPTVRESQGL